MHAQSEQKQQQEEDKDTKRRARLEERRARFQKRRKDGAGSAAPSSTPLMDTDTDKPLDDLSDGTPRPREERPRQTGRRRPKEDDSDSGRKIRRWKPGEKNVTKAVSTTARPRRARPKSDRPDPANIASGTGADRLLERLRKRRDEEEQ